MGRYLCVLCLVMLCLAILAPDALGKGAKADRDHSQDEGWPDDLPEALPPPPPETTWVDPDVDSPIELASPLPTELLVKPTRGTIKCV